MKTTTAPLALFLHPSASSTIPADLRALPRWLCWTMEDDKKKPKDPRAPQHRGGFAWGDCTRLADFETAFASARAAGEGFGVGFALLLEDGFTALDLDNALDNEGTAKPWARPLLDDLEALATYCETSPRSVGVRSVVRGKLSTAFSEVVLDGKVEAWSSGRWVSFTGRRIDGDEIPEADPVELLARYAKPKQLPPSASPQECNGKHFEPKGCSDSILRTLLAMGEERLAKGKGRNETLFTLCGQVRDNSGTVAQAEAFARDFVQLCGRYPRDHSFTLEGDALPTARSAMNGPKREPWEDSLDGFAIASTSTETESNRDGPQEDHPDTTEGAPFEWKTPRPLEREHVAPPLPQSVLLAFPDWILTPVLAVAETYESDEVLGVFSALAALSFISLGTATSVAFAKWRKPQALNFYAIATARPGRGKSENLELFSKPLDEIEDDRMRFARKAYARELAKRDLAKATLGKLKDSAAKGDGDAAEQFLDLSAEGAEELLVAPRERIGTQSTPEALADVALANSGQFCLMSAEAEALGQLLPTYRSGSRIVPEIVTGGFDAKATRIIRSGEGKTRLIPNTHGVVFILAQEKQLNRIICEPTFAEGGFLSRCLIAKPRLPRKVGNPEDGEGIPAHVEETYRSRMVELGTWLSQFKSPGVIRYGSEALVALKAIYAETNVRREAEDGDLYNIADSVARVEQIAIRCGALIHLARHEKKAFEVAVEADVAEAVVDLAHYSLDHAKALLAPLDPAVVLAHKILDRATREGLRTEWRLVQQGLKRCTAWAHVEEALDLLEERNLARKVEESAGPQGGRPKVFLDLNPALFEGVKA